jgi:O-antigen ligase
MIVMGSLIAVFGIVQRMTWTGRFYWIGPEAPHAEAFGPFVNRAHFAGLMVIVVPMTLALWLSRKPESSRRRSERRCTWKDRLYRWSTGEAGAVRLIPFLILLMGGAALVSRSRGGLVALLAGLVSMVGLASRGRSGARPAVRVALATALIVLAGIWIGGDILYGTVERLAEEVGRPAESARVQIWGDALDLWRRSPVVGTGLASFAAAFPAVRTLQAPVAFIHAESDWVQLLTDTGLLGLALALAAAAAVGTALLRRLRKAASPRSRALALAGFVGLLGAIVQGIGNYNLPVMSNLTYLAAALVPALRSED